MNKRLILGIGLIFLAGCATTRQPNAVDQVQIKVSQLEFALAKKDQEIDALKYQIDHLSNEMEKLQRNKAAMVDVPQTNQKTGQSLNTASTPIDLKEIIRVDARPEEIQKALKNAGFYEGPVDGKIGHKSQQAIKDFQAAHNLTNDGIVGQKTWVELKRYTAGINDLPATEVETTEQ